ncbi:MAG: cytochrome c [Deltaproteobacteria bacterium]|nr:cytochrome c [Deltaproteobacteria bacterium]
MRRALFLLLFAAPAFAQQAAPFRLKEGPGRELVSAKCVVCHSLDYIQMNSPFLDRAGWGKTVEKMIKAMGANISDEESKRITDYLAENYGVKSGA